MVVSGACFHRSEAWSYSPQTNNKERHSNISMVVRVVASNTSCVLGRALLYGIPCCTFFDEEIPTVLDYYYSTQLYSTRTVLDRNVHDTMASSSPNIQTTDQPIGNINNIHFYIRRRSLLV